MPQAELHDLVDRLIEQGFALERRNDSLSQKLQELERQVDEQAQQYEFRMQEARAVLDTVIDPIITIDSKGIIETVNRAAETTFGYYANQMVGHRVTMLMPAPCDSRHNECLQRFLSKELPSLVGQRREFMARQKSGALIPIELSVSRIDHQPRFTGLLRDVRKVKQLQNEVMQAAEEERSRISRELHDCLGQELSGLAMQAQALAGHPLLKQDKAGEQFQRFCQQLELSIKQLRSIVFDLSPVEMADGGLVESLRALARVVDSQGLEDCRCEIEGSVVPGLWPRQLEIQLLRVAKEALHNARKHAGAKHIVLYLCGRRDELELRVEDDGCGVNHQQRLEDMGQGIRIMQYRASLVGGELLVEPRENKGTRVICRVGLPRT
ncbi:PAS domain S-box protein [Marinobacteraceae bacterium S3BR75-40.1]